MAAAGRATRAAHRTLAAGRRWRYQRCLAAGTRGRHPGIPEEPRRRPGRRVRRRGGGPRLAGRAAWPAGSRGACDRRRAGSPCPGTRMDRTRKAESCDGEEELGRGLAIVHQAGAPSFDALPPGSPRRQLRFGGVVLPLDAVAEGSSWAAHYAARLELLAGVASDRGRIDAGTAAAIGLVVERIETLAGPPEPPARLHGDLWSGNVHAGADGRPWLIDPAAHGGHRELDLAMLRLFGTISETNARCLRGRRPARRRSWGAGRALAAAAAAGPRDPLRWLLRRRRRPSRPRLRLTGRSIPSDRE